MLARRLVTEIEVELAGLRRLAEEFAGAPTGGDTFALRARASILHDFYTGAERIFVRIAVDRLTTEVRAFGAWMLGRDPV